MYCWAQNTYWVPMTDPIPASSEIREQRQISYYQWIPFFLLLAAVSFYLPCLIWRFANDFSGFLGNESFSNEKANFEGFRIVDIISLACSENSLDSNGRSKNIETLVCHFDHVLEQQRSQRLQKSSSRCTHRFRWLKVCHFWSFFTKIVQFLFIY